MPVQIMLKKVHKIQGQFRDGSDFWWLLMKGSAAEHINHRGLSSLEFGLFGFKMLGFGLWRPRA